MTIDLGQFIQIFLEEAREHVAEMEAGLLALDLQAPDPEQLNAIFRAAHSIKGGAGTFGFGSVADFTHVLETLLDRVRHGRLRLDEVKVDACLRAVDVLSAMLAVEPARAAQVEGAAELARTLASMASEAGGAAPVEPGGVFRQVRASPSGPRRYLVSIQVPESHRLPIGTLPNLLDTFGQLGKVVVLEQPPGGAQAGSWRVWIETEAGQAELLDFASFVLAPEWLRIDVDEGEPPQSMPPQPEPVPGPPVAPPGEEAYGFFDPLPAEAGADLEPFAPAVGVGVVTVPAADGDPGYGFFEPLTGLMDEAVAGAARDPGYGFFDVEPDSGASEGAPPEPALHAEPAAVPAMAAVGVDAGYGFFEPLPSAAPSVAAPPDNDGPEVVPVGRAATVREAEPAPARAAVSAGAGESSIRVGTAKVDQLIDLVGELVITQSMLLQSAGTLDPILHERILGGLAQLERNTRDLQEAVMSIRMLPVSMVFSRFPRMVRDLARRLGKEAELHLEGESTELDRGLIERIVDPLTHLVRNAVDHGLESPAGREAAGKLVCGRITLSAAHQSGQIVIEIADDGAGLNRGRILAQARRQGLPVSEAMSDSEVWELIFAPGFSTAEEVTEVSGRGVGMDVVRRNIQALGGSVHIASEAGRGTRIGIRLPLTLAILDGMSVCAGAETFIVPLGFVVESLHGEALEFRSMGRSGQVVRVRDDYLPVACLAQLFDIPDASREVEGKVLVVLEAENRRLALAVDALLGQHQVVVKNLETNYRRVTGIAGATILGDGQVSLILDVGGLVKLANPGMPGVAA